MAARAPQMRRALRWTAALLGALASMLLIALAVVQTAPAKRQLAALISHLASTPGRLTVELRGIEGRVPTDFSIAEISIADPEGRWLHVTGIRAQGSPRELLRGRIHLERASAATVDLARLPRLPHDDEPFELPRVWRTLVVDLLHVDALRVGRELWEEARDGGRAEPQGEEWSAPIFAEVSGAYAVHEQTLTVRLTLNARQSTGLLPPSVALRTRDLRLTGAIEGYVFRPKGALTLTARAPSYGDDLTAGALDVQIRGAPSDAASKDAPYDVSIESTLRDPRVSDLVDAMLGPEVHAAASARIEADGKKIHVGTLELQAAALAAHSTANVQDGDVTVPRIDVDVRDLGKLGGEVGDVIDGGELKLNARMEADARSSTASGSASATSAGLALADPTLQRLVGSEISLTGSFEVERSERALHVSDIRLRAAHAELHGDATISGTPAVVDASLAMNVDDLGAVTDAAFDGSVQLDAALRGPLDALAVEAAARSDRLRVRHGPAFSGTMALSAADVARAPSGTLRADVKSAYGPITAGADFKLVPGETLSVSNVTIGATGATLTASAVVDLPSKIATGTVTGNFTDVAALSPLAGARLQGSGKLDARLFGENGDQRAEVSAQAAALSYGGLRGVHVKQAKVDAVLHSLGARPAGDVRVAAKSVRIADASIAVLEATASGANGSWTIAASAEGRYLQQFQLRYDSTLDLTAPGVSGRVRTLEGTLGRRPLSLEREIVFARVDDKISVEHVAIALGEARARGSLTAMSERLDGVLEIEQFPLDLLQLYNPTIDLKGAADGRVTVAGTRQSPDVHFTVDATSVAVGTATAGEIPPVDVHGEGRWNDQGLVTDATLSGGEGTRFDLHAEVPPGRGGVSIALDGTANVALVSGLGMLGEDRVKGVMQANLVLAGTMDAPRVTGDVVLNDGSYENAALGASVQNVNLHLVGEGTRLMLERFDATDGANGRITASGGVDFASGVKNASYGLDVTLESARVARRDDLSGKASGNLRVAGAGPAPIITGTITAHRADVRIPERLPPEVVELQFVEKNVAAAREDRFTTSEPPDTIPAELELDIHMPDHIFVRGSEVDTEWRGDLHVGGTARDPVLDGKLTLVRGTFNLVNVRFKAAEGTIAFDGGEKIDPLLNVVGETKKHDILARVTITGRASKPEVTFTSEPPLPQDEVVARLLFGKEPGQLSAVESVQLAAAVARLSGKGGGGADPLGWLQRTFNVDTVGITSADTAEGGSVLSVGKYVTDRVFVSVNQGLSEDSSSASVEVEVRDNVTLQTRIGNVEGRLGVNWKWDY